MCRNEEWRTILIDKKEVIEFFDKCAPGWDACMIRNDDIIQMILDNAGV